MSQQKSSKSALDTNMCETTPNSKKPRTSNNSSASVCMNNLSVNGSSIKTALQQFSHISPVKTALTEFQATPSPSTVNKSDVTIVWKIIDSSGTIVGTTIEGADIYAFSKYFQLKLSEESLKHLNPYSNNTESEIAAIPIPGKLLKANELDKQLHSDFTGMCSAEIMSKLKQNAPYIVSATGKEGGNTKLWIFSVFQLYKKYGFEANYEVMVHNVILKFLNYARRPSKAHLGTDKSVLYPRDEEEAMQFYDKGECFNVELKEFVLDTNDKFDIYSSIARSDTY